MASKYVGPRSCWGRKEGVYVPGSGVNRENASGIVALILFDYLRGWTYNSRCQKIPMTKARLLKRLNYMIPLAVKHSPKDVEYVRELVKYVIKHWRIPEWALPVRLAGWKPRIEMVKESLAYHGVLPTAKATARARARAKARARA